VAEDSACERSLADLQASFSSAEAALRACLNFLGEDPTAMGVLGATAAALSAVEVARIWWRRHHGEQGPAFPLDQ